ncbi:PP2C family protein-serine/threonine phosphatase [Salmonirosea aquatica]|uniref:Serine/threonine-protein phosphatase n=1 Tax=Salmonirosea aquatica TaxID=2654236 RepID=A0A7C9BEX1_9BACT|nr:serine/threonine-protein phosphatase [Cytophagaceae bacterium SJW1-29]
MTISIDKPVTFSLIGQRVTNQDYVYPVDERSGLFIVCDGIGGWDQGEVASRLVAEAVARFMEQHPTDCIEESYLAEALASAYRTLLEYLSQNRLLSRLGTTLALLQLTSRGATVAHVGDSRVYHMRGGVILHQTLDHKYVQDLVAGGIITEEQALNHPRRHTLSRSIGVQSNESPLRMDKGEIAHIADIQMGDFFFLCTDGVLEQVDDQSLRNIFAQYETSQDIADQLLGRCRNLTRDNYSGCLVRIKHVSREKANLPFGIFGQSQE